MEVPLTWDIELSREKGQTKTEVAGEAKTEEERTGAEQNPHEGLSGSEDFEGLRQALECAEAVEQNKASHQT